MKLLKVQEHYIGIDGGILMGRPSVIVVGLAVLTSWFCWCPVAAKDNIFRGIVSAIIQGIVILLIATAMTNIHDIMAVQSGYVYAEGITHTSALVMGQELLPDLLYKIFSFLGG